MQSAVRSGPGKPRRWRALLLVVLLTAGLVVGVRPAASRPRPPGENVLRVGTYLQSIDNLDLQNNSFEAQLYLWTLWSGDPERNPSDALELLNDVHDGDLYQFEEKARRRQEGVDWRLYAVHSRFVHRWRLQAYPFDSHLLRIRVGLRDPFERRVRLEADGEGSAASPELYLYGWSIGDVGISRSSTDFLSTLGRPASGAPSAEGAQTITTTLELVRRSRLHLVPDFLGYILAVGLCVLALLIQRTRDDLILAAVVSAAGNYVFLAGILPVGAMSGFIGRLQLVILAGILYVVGADEILDHHLGRVAPGRAAFLRSAVLPSYLLITMIAIYLIIPTGVVETG
ncbi:MAG: hypothetical protein VKI81_09455 [Synechococcaceae cyanobacterium]|nr:hypothetical protein [Synechococcaceae cyanobacterium]